MVTTRQITNYLVVAIVTSFVAGCTFKPTVISAYIQDGGAGTEMIEVTISADDAKTIKARETYFSIIVLDCKHPENQFPVKPLISGMPASKFSFPVSDGFVKVQGAMPAKFLVDFPNPCVKLQGGSYLFGKLDSVPVALKRR